MAEETSPTFKIIISSHCHPTKPPSRNVLLLKQDATVKELSDAVADLIKIPSYLFQMNANLSKVIPNQTDEELSKNVFEFFKNVNANIVVFINRREEFDVKDPKYANIFDPSQESLARSSQNEHTIGPIQSEATRPEPSSSFRKETQSSSSVQTSASWTNSSYSLSSKSDTGFCGLSNQGATCYLNSLLQTLYMTPEFRSALYNWSFEEFSKRDFDKKLAVLEESREKAEGESDATTETEGKSVEEMFENYKIKLEENCIPRQLQKLFLKLNTSDKRAVETKNLTKSFGWKQDDAFTQHDVQELCRVLFDKVDKVWEGTEQANLINELYQGEMKDYVQCMTCGHESSRSDKFLDIPLVIKGFGETKAISSISEALEKFIEPETLKEENQYFCDKCAKKSDARKGLKFIKLPYLLCLQLKRFDFDFQTMRRIKLNDRVTFPEILDMNSFVIGGGLSTSKKKRQLESQNEDNEDRTFDEDSRFPADDGNKSMSDRMRRKREIEREIALKNGPYVYELFSVLIHRGSALGGHYFAYIKSFLAGKWYEFNDSTVKEIASDAYTETFGDREEKKSFFNSGTNAYMLMYRQCDPTRNIVEYSKQNLPESIKQLIEEENRIEEEKEQEKERQRAMCTFKLFYKDQPPVEVKVNKNEKLETVKLTAAKRFNLESYLPHNLRLREYSSFSLIPSEPISNENLEKACGETPLYTVRHIYVETKQENEEFSKYNKQDITLRVTCYDSQTGTWSQFAYFTFSPKTKVKEVKEALAARYNIPLDNLLVVKEEVTKNKILRSDHLEVNREFSLDGAKVYVEHTNGDDKEPKAFEEIDRVKNTIEITFTNADEKEYKHKLLVDKRITVYELKKKIEKVIDLSIDEFLVYRVASETYRTEVRNEDDKLTDCYIYGSTKLAIEKGKPFRKGEIPCKYILYDPISETKTDLFELALPGKLSLLQVKEEVIKRFNELQASEQTKRKDNISLPADPLRLRMRNLYGNRPSNVFPNTKTLKEVTANRYSGLAMDLYIQILPENQIETKTTDDKEVVIILRQFHPDKYELGNPIEFVANKEEKLGALKERVANLIGIPFPELTLAMADHYDIQQIIRIPLLSWYPKPKEDKPDDYRSKYTSGDFDPDRPLRSLNLSDGDILLCRNLSVARKKLTEAEERKIKDEEEKKRQKKNQYYSARKEERLDIKITDVSIVD